MACGPRQKHAFLIGGTHSGCGKTTIALALLAALRARGLDVQPFKVGPDFIDPGLHARIAGKQSRNLDGWMLGQDWNIGLFRRLLKQSDAGLIEGVMGLFDGYDGRTESGSSAEMAKWLGVPVVLVVDARSMARSAAALIYGFTHFDPALEFAGVIFNRIGGEAHLEYLKEALGSACPGVAVLGGIPREERVSIPERHLGLVTADEMNLDAEWQKRLAGLVEKHIDIGLLLSKAGVSAQLEKGAESDGGLQPLTAHRSPFTPVIAVARDAAFCFYYPDNLELLEQAGARIRFFSPISGETFPGGILRGVSGWRVPGTLCKADIGQCRFSSGASRARRAGNADLCRMRRFDVPLPLYRNC